MVGTGGEVLAHGAADRVGSVEAGAGPRVAIAGGDATRRAQQPRAHDRAGLDGLADLQVEEILLGHDAHGGRPGQQVAPQIISRPQRAAGDWRAHLAGLVALAGVDRDVAMGIDQPGHDELIAQVDRLRIRRSRRRLSRTNGHNPPGIDNDGGILDRLRAGAIEQRPTPQRHDHVESPPRRPG
jgi:hypothetical protein